MVWDGIERRKGDRRKMGQGVDRDWLERDRLITEIHGHTLHMMEWAKKHDESDTARFKLVNDKVSVVERIAYLGIGGLAVLNVLLVIVFK